MFVHFTRQTELKIYGDETNCMDFENYSSRGYLQVNIQLNYKKKNLNYYFKKVCVFRFFKLKPI